MTVLLVMIKESSSLAYAPLYDPLFHTRKTDWGGCAGLVALVHSDGRYFLIHFTWGFVSTSA